MQQRKPGLSFDWILHYKCNYNCPYCAYSRRRKEQEQLKQQIFVEKLIEAWIKIYEKYSTVYINLNGGEPFIYPSFLELAAELSKKHFINIKTNLSCSMEMLKDFVKIGNCNKLKLSAVFHPLFAEFETFLEKALFLKEKKLAYQVFYIAYPPQIRQINYYREKFEAKGLQLSVLPFYGRYNEADYPECYTQEEQQLIGDNLGECDEYQGQLINKEERLCQAGYRFIVIQPDGNVNKCNELQDVGLMGNLFDINFKLLDKPTKCKLKSCSHHFKWSVQESEQKNNPSLFYPPPYKVYWNWDTHYSCNYNCSYCNYAIQWDYHSKSNRYIEIDKWLEIWDRMFKRYGSCHIHLSGGEPSIYPHFGKLITELSQKHTLEISTNFSFEPSLVLGKISPKRLKIDASFHPEHVDYNGFLNKVLLLKENGFNIPVTYVGYPPLLEKMQDFKAGFDKFNIPFNILPFRGKFQNKEYPLGYTAKEIELIRICGGDSLSNKNYLDANIKERENNQELCRMGQMYAKIFPDGRVARCCYNHDIGVLGNIIDDKDFKLLEEPQPCPAEVKQCPCWKAMIVGREHKWLPNWNTYLEKD